MMTVLRNIRILVIIQLLTTTRCQDGFGDRDILRYQQMSADDGQIETITGFSIIQREPNNQASSSSQQYQQYTDNASKNEDYSRTGRRKIYRIKNPFHQDENERPSENEPQDSSTGASNQYAAMQYSLPPEEFLQQLRAENQLYQQQVSTPSPNLGFTVTPQPQYQYSTPSPPSYDNSNQIQLQAKISPSQSYPSSYQYSTPNSFLDSIQSTPSPVPSYLSTPINPSQYVGTQSSTYVSSASPIYLSSPPNLQQYISSPISVIQTPSSDYNGNRGTSTIGSNPLSYDNGASKKLQADHYDYSANNYRYPMHIQQQYQNDYSSTTTTTSSPYSMRESSWQNTANSGVNALSKSLQELSFSQYQNNNHPYNNNQQEVRTDASSDNNGDTHRIGNMASANNIYMNYAQPDNQMMNNLKIRTRDLENQTGQKELYSNGDYGWKLNGKRPVNNNEVYSSEYSRYQMPNLSSDVAVSQMSFHMDTGKTYNSEQVKPVTESIESQEFAKAAAKAHDRLKQQQQYYTNNYGPNNEGNSYYTIHDKQKNKYTNNLNTNQYIYTHNQNDLVTASPYLISNSRDSGDRKFNQPFDHNKALKNIVPIDVSNVVSNSGSALNQATDSDYSNRFSTSDYEKDQQDQNVRQYIRPVSDSYYKDKHSVYNFNIKPNPDDYVTPDSLKQIEAAIYAKQQQIQDQSYNQGSYPSASQNYGYNPQGSNYQDSMQSSSIQQPGLQRNHNSLTQDIASLLKLNDVPYRVTHSLPNDALKLHNVNFDQGTNPIPTPLPTRINQNVDSHQLDVATNLLNKLLQNKQASMAINRPIESDSQSSLPTINGFKIANPFNLDLKLVAEMLKGKPTVDDSYLMSMRDTYTKPSPLKLDLSQLQHLLNNENNANLAPMNDGLGALNNPYMDIYNNGRFPYQGVKYSRSQEEEESLPISDSANNHPIGAVIEQDDSASEREVSAATDLTGQGDDVIPINFDETRSKHLYISSHRNVGDRQRSPNSFSGRHSYQRKYPKNDVEEPYPLLKPPPRRSPVARSNHNMKMEKNRRRRVTKPKVHRVMKSEPMFEAGVDPESLETSVPILLRPPPPIAESKSDTILDENST